METEHSNFRPNDVCMKGSVNVFTLHPLALLSDIYNARVHKGKTVVRLSIVWRDRRIFPDGGVSR